MGPLQVGSVSPVPEANLTPAHLWLNEDSWRVDMEGWGWGRHTAIRLLALVYSREGGIWGDPQNSTTSMLGSESWNILLLLL